MSPRWVMGLAVLFFLLSMMSSIIEGLYMTGTDTTTIYSAMSHFTNINYASPVFIDTIYDVAVGVGLILEALWNMFIWNYSFLTGSFEIVRWLLISVSAALFLAFMYETIRLVKISG